MSRYKPYGSKSKSQSGAGFQFDKLLKVCSNSKKASSASATKTVGNLGRFGSTNFTSTRNSNLDSSGEDDINSTSLYKRPRLEEGVPVIPPAYTPSYGYPPVYGQPQNQNIPGFHGSYMPMPQENAHSHTSNNVPTEAIKPKKFFKSRNPLGTVDPKPALPYMAAPPRLTPAETQHYVPPITIPKPKLSDRTLSDTKQTQAKTSNRGRKPKAAAVAETVVALPEPKAKGGRGGRRGQGAKSNTAAITIPTPEVVTPAAPTRTRGGRGKKQAADAEAEGNANSLTSPSIKLRIFKDKTTSTFMSVSDASPPKLQAEKSPEKKKKEKKPEKAKKEKPAVVDPPVGRITRNTRRRQRNSDSSTEAPMPSLRRVSGIEAEAQANNAQQIVPEGRRDSGQELVKKFEEEDDEFRQMSAMLSSMEGEEESSSTAKRDLHLNSSNGNNASPEHAKPATPKRDIRSILEDDWNDDEDTPKKGSQTPKHNFTRFDMAAIVPEHSSGPSAAPPMEAYQATNMPPRAAEIVREIPVNNKPFNAPYAVRNLLADFTDKVEEPKSEPEPVADVAASTMQTLTEEITTRSRLAKKGGSNSINLLIKPQASTTKKVSIFKSRAVTTNATTEGEIASPKKRLALYKHKFGQESGEKADQSVIQTPTSSGGLVTFDEEYDERGIRIKNVKAIHELQESGEAMEFDGDILYILDDLKDKNPISSRCLSAITLAMRCMEPAFRMHLRAHGTVGEFCKELHDAPNNPVLALLAATVLFVLSQDRLNMDLDTDSLQLLLALTKLEEQTHLIDESPEIAKHRQKVIDLISEMKQRGRATDLNIEKISASELALETLLHLTSKRAGDWVKHELRILGGLDYIVSEVDKLLNILSNDFSSPGWPHDESVMERLSKIDRCLRVLHQVSFDHEDNQRFLLGAQEYSDIEDKDLSFRRKQTPSVFAKLLRVFSDQLNRLPVNSGSAQMLRDTIMAALKLLVNLSQDHRGIILGSEILSSQEGLIDLTLYSVFNLSANFPDDKAFELLINALQLLMNLVEHSRSNRSKILQSTVYYCDESTGTNKTTSSIDAFVEMFCAKELQAKEEELHTDNILTTSTDGKEKKDSQGSSDSQKSQQEKDAEGSSSQGIIDKLVETAGKHMENSLLAAYISLLLAYMIMDDPDSTEHVRNSLPNGKFLPLMVFLKKLFNFMSITSAASGSIRGLKATSSALKFFGDRDPSSSEELKKVIPD